MDESDKLVDTPKDCDREELAYHFVKRNGSICESSCSENETDGVESDGEMP